MCLPEVRGETFHIVVATRDFPENMGLNIDPHNSRALTVWTPRKKLKLLETPTSWDMSTPLLQTGVPMPHHQLLHPLFERGAKSWVYGMLYHEKVSSIADCLQGSRAHISSSIRCALFLKLHLSWVLRATQNRGAIRSRQTYG